MKKKVFNIVYLALIATILASGCAPASTPTEAIKAPKAPAMGVNNSSQSEDPAIIVQRFIPEGYKLLDANLIASEKNIFELDVDNDKTNEILAFIKNDEKFQKGFIVLKKQNNKWAKIHEKISEANSISMVDIVNAYNKDTKNLLVGFKISSHAGSGYYLYNFKDGKARELYLGMYKRFEILNTPAQNKDKGLVFATWMDYGANIQVCELIGFNGISFFSADELYADYFNKEVIKYYEELLKDNTNCQFIWNQLIEAQINAGKSEEALTSINKVIDIKKSNDTVFHVDDYVFDYLKGRALNKLTRYKEAEEILGKTEKNILKLSESTDGFVNERSFNLSKVYLELGKNYIAQNRKTEAKEVLTKSLDILEKLSTKNYFVFDKNVYIAPVKNELDKLK